MRKVIEGKLYDTDRSDEVFHFSNGLPSTDFSYVRETLYRTKGGAFFLVGQGGAATQYREIYSGTVTEGMRVIAMSPDDALQWLSEHGGDEVAAALFSLEDA